MNSWMLPVLAIGGIGAAALILVPNLLGKDDNGDDNGKRRKGRHHRRGDNTHDKNDGYGDLYRQRFMERPPVKRLPVVDVSDIIDRQSAENDELSYIITDKDFKLYDINRPDLPGYKPRIKEPLLSKVIYGDKGDRPVIVPYYDGYSYATSVTERTPEFSKLTPGQQSLSNDNTNHINLYSK